MASYTIKSLYVGALTNSNSTLYTCSTAAGGIIKEILICNLSGSARYVTLYFVPFGGSSSVSNIVLSSQRVEASSTLVLALNSVINVSDFIQAFADSASQVSIRISGVEAT